MKRLTKKIMILCFLLSFTVAACEAKTSCALQAVAGGSQACQEEQNK